VPSVARDPPFATTERFSVVIVVLIQARVSAREGSRPTPRAVQTCVAEVARGASEGAALLEANSSLEGAASTSDAKA
jgi:hypothetical protein